MRRDKTAPRSVVDRAADHYGKVCRYYLLTQADEGKFTPGCGLVSQNDWQYRRIYAIDRKTGHDYMLDPQMHADSHARALARIQESRQVAA